MDADQKVLWCDDQPVHVTPKVFDTLLVLLQNPRRIVEKEELMNRLWPDVFVEETNLTFNIQQLRKALGDSAQQPTYSETVSRRGYRFIATVEEGLAGARLMNGQSAAQIETATASAPTATADFKDEPAILAASATVTSGPSATGVARNSARKAVALAGTVLVLASAGLVYWRNATGAASILHHNAKLAAALKLEKLTGTGQSRHVAISPDGKYIAYKRLLKGKASTWLRQLATNTNVEIVAPGSPVYGLAFTQSGEYLYFVRGAPRALYRISPLGGVPTKIVEKLEGNFSISADDRQIAFIRVGLNREGQYEESLLIAGADGTGERTLLVVTHPAGLAVPIWSGDGRAIICTYGNSDGGSQTMSLVEVRLADGVKRELSPDRFFHVWKLAWLPTSQSALARLVSRRADQPDHRRFE